jgi:hypothetical protein
MIFIIGIWFSIPHAISEFDAAFLLAGLTGQITLSLNIFSDEKLPCRHNRDALFLMLQGAR